MENAKQLLAAAFRDQQGGRLAPFETELAAALDVALAQRDELLAALKVAGDTLRKPGVVSYEDRIAALAMIDAAIAKAEGR
ncbi:MAG: hypothetical protein ING29_00805 [Azospirillum sp.]|nr:hypothetical protein [Azospirillum sp.]